MNTCPKCGETLNIDEKASGKCFSCGASFAPSEISGISQKERKPRSNDWNSEPYYKNTMAKILSRIGTLIVALGLIGSFVLAITTGDGDFSWLLFFSGVIISAIGGFVFLGFAEVIRLLDEINDKLKKQ